jgi:hypothetical protein
MVKMKQYLLLFFRYALLTAISSTFIFACAPAPVSPTARPPVVVLQPTFTARTQPAIFPSASVQEPAGQVSNTPARDIVLDLLGQIDRNRALTDLQKITGEEPLCNDAGCYKVSNRQTGSAGLQRVKNYINAELVKSGYSVEINNWSRSKYSDQNLIAKKMGVSSPGEEIFLVAHLDGVIKEQRLRYPGADDDASGVVDILELARVLSNYSFNRTLVIFFSTGEEQGSLGVKSYLSQLTSKELSSIKYIIDVDMIGYDANNDGVMQLWHGGHSPSEDLTQTMRKIIVDYRLSLAPKITDGCG